MGRRSGGAGKDPESRVDAMPGTACLRGRRRRRGKKKAFAYCMGGYVFVTTYT